MTKSGAVKKTSGLELGSFTQLNHQIHTSDRQYDYIYTPETNEVMKTKRTTKEHTGISTMVIEETVVKIFNHGYSDDGSYGNHFMLMINTSVETNSLSGSVMIPNKYILYMKIQKLSFSISIP